MSSIVGWVIAGIITFLVVVPVVWLLWKRRNARLSPKDSLNKMAVLYFCQILRVTEGNSLKETMMTLTEVATNIIETELGGDESKATTDKQKAAVQWLNYLVSD